MRWIKWTGIVAAILLIVACCMTWVVIPSKNITVSGINSSGTNFGKPAVFHFFMTFLFLLFTIIPRVWVKRSNLLVTGINMAWAVRNYFMITVCRGGECPQKQVAIYAILFLSFIMLVSSLLPDMKTRKTTKL